MCEEAGPTKTPLACKIAGLREVSYYDVDIPQTVKGLIYYEFEGKKVMNEDDTAYELDTTWVKYRKAWGLVREFHMSRSFIKHAAGHSDTLLICGISHLQGLKELLRENFLIADVTPNYEHITPIHNPRSPSILTAGAP